MRRTAEQIEESKEQRASAHSEPSGKQSVKRVIGNPDKTIPYRFKPGQCGNPGGRPKNDLAKEIAQAVFAQDPEAIRAAMERALLKGNAYVFKELADRGYGKVSDKLEMSGQLTVTLAERLESARRALKAKKGEDE